MPPKRPYDRGLSEPNVRGKWQKTAGFYSQNQSFKVSPGSVVFRLLCHASKTGCVIGKGGSVISQIRQETNARVRLEESVLGCDERIIVIVGSDKEFKVGKGSGEDSNVAEAGNDTREHGKDDGDKDSAPEEDLNSEKGQTSVQKALLLIFEKMIGSDIETNKDDEENKSSTCVVRLLILSNQVGCILGKGGSVIKQMSTESGAQIRILPNEKLPACASASDELLQITGELDAARKALQMVSQQLLENAPRESDLFPSSSVGPSAHSLGHPHPRPEVFPSPFAVGPYDGVDYHSAPPLIPKFHESGIHGCTNPVQDILTFRLLCHFEKIGGIIGKGGAIIKAVQVDTGCEIKILEGDSDDRIVLISGPAHPDDRISAAQEGVLRVQSRMFKPTSDSFEKNAVARLLVSSNQIGCLLGKGGAIISEMRKSSGAHIRILGKEQIPKCASENEVVQINGEFGAVQEALLQITSRLRHHFFRDVFPPANHPSNPAFPDQIPPFPYMGRVEFSPPGMYSNLGPSFHKFDLHGGLPPLGGFRAHDDRPPFMHNINRPVVPPHISERIPSSAQWGPQGLSEGGGRMGLPEHAGVPQRRIAGYAGGQPVITSTTVEVIVPRSLVPSIYGQDGESLKQIRQISEAKVTITEPKPGATETVVIISGTPEQSHAAQSLIQAFVMCGTGTP